MTTFDPLQPPDPSDTAAVDAYCRMRRTVRGLRRSAAMLAVMEGVWRPCRTGTGVTMWRNDRRFTIRPVDSRFTLREETPGTSAIVLGIFETVAEAKAAADHAAASGG